MRLLITDPDLGYTLGGCWLVFAAACMAVPSTIRRARERSQR